MGGAPHIAEDEDPRRVLREEERPMLQDILLQEGPRDGPDPLHMQLTKRPLCRMPAFYLCLLLHVADDPNVPPFGGGRHLILIGAAHAGQADEGQGAGDGFKNISLPLRLPEPVDEGLERFLVDPGVFDGVKRIAPYPVQFPAMAAEQLLN